jgi:hypothetical protein
LGLRNPERLNIAKLGVKSFILARNNFTDYFAEKFALSLKGDEYIKFVDLKKNKITIQGMKYFTEAAVTHPGLFSIDLRFNPCQKAKESKKLRKIMGDAFMSNIKDGIAQAKLHDSRIKTDWIIPDCLGLEKNKLDDHVDSMITFAVRRNYFVELISEISEKTGLKWNSVMHAFIGNNIEQINSLKRALERL